MPDDDEGFFFGEEQRIPTKKLANHFSAWMDEARITEVTLLQVEVSRNQFGKCTEKLSELSDEADAAEETWVLVRSQKRNDPYSN